ncbi:MAG: hypothetical protein FJZ49_02630 [Candidatus Verstraetearchaeota archaeon]|nr:hypothetical protein [Candidatus Verstraetearchaeota archaeon]
MKLQIKTLVILSIIGICMVGMVYVSTRIIIMNGFLELEKQETLHGVEIVVGAISERFSRLSSICSDYSLWDDTYAFINDRNINFIDTNLVDQTFIGLNLNVMLFFNSSGFLVYGKAFDLQTLQEVPIPSDLVASVSSQGICSYD